jgi:twinfilin-like protein
MLYSSGARGAFATAKNIITSPGAVLASRKIETSDPKEIDEAFIRAEMGVGSEGASASGSGVATPNLRDEEKKPFARPKGPGRKR